MDRPSDIGNKICTTQQAADLLEVTPRTIQLWTNSGILKARKTPGGHRRFVLKDIEALYEQNQKPVAGDSKKTLMRIMVIDDDPDLLTLYRYMIERWELPLELKTALDGYEALVMIGSWKPDIVITDIRMPNVDGVQLLNAVVNQRVVEQMLVVVVSALSKEEIKKKGGVPDGIPIFTKPIPFDRLESMVRQKCKDNNMEKRNE